MSAITAEGLAFGWSLETPLFRDLSFTLGDERAALVGANGVGKSTLLRLLLGELQPTAGVVQRRGVLAYVPQAFDRRTTIAETLGVADALAAHARIAAGAAEAEDYDRLDGLWDIEARAEAALADMGLENLDWDRKLATLSGGQAMRARLAGALLNRPDMLILDEPTNDLDADGRDALYALVEGWSTGLLVVSHDRALLSRVDRILELTTLGLTSYGGAYEVYRAAKEAEAAALTRRLADARKDVASAARAAQDRRERAERSASAGKRRNTGSVPTIVLGAMKRRAQRTAAKLDKLGEDRISKARTALDQVEREVERKAALAFDLPSCGLPAGKRVLDFETVTARHEGAAAPVFRELSFRVTGPERIAIVGPNGAGKSTLLALAAGTLTPAAGEVRLGVERWAMLDQRLDRLPDEGDVLDGFLSLNPERTAHEAREALARFGFRGRAVQAPVATLSGGERLRAALAATLAAAEPPQLLMLDEPTNHLDLQSVETLEAALRAYDGAILAVSHDPWFLEAIQVEREIGL
ncbi:MAG: ABC-F family ATP-binding cassette domain-containing protein [Pseudomonadota bacterium]